MSDVVEMQSQFSQVTRHDVAVEKSKNFAENRAIEHAPPVGNVTLISNHPQACHAPEKIPFITSPDDAWKADCETLSKMDLRRRYSREATCHRNMLSRRKARGAVVSPSFEDFRSFLKFMGPMPVAGATVDRKDNSDPEYAPGKVSWADKRTQNGNKGDSLLFHCSRTGEIYTTSRLAKLQNVSATAIRKRFERGWSDDEIIERKQAKHVIAPQRPPSSKGSPRAANETCSRGAYDRTESPRSVAEIAFERMAEYMQRHREEFGEEALPATLDVLNDHGSPLPRVTEEQYERRFRKLWPEYRPHLHFWKALPAHQQLIEKIDPDYVEKQKREKLMSSVQREEL
ncbi:MAG: hypothetical protein ACLPSW_29580 [Roseiarcus sp.]